MKKIMILLMVLLLCGCGGKKEEPVTPEPEPEPAPEPAPAPEPEPSEVEYVTKLDDKFVAYMFKFEHENETFVVDDDLSITFSGGEKKTDYCNGACTVYDSVKVNGKEIEFMEKMDVQINSKYGVLSLYNLNDELYLLHWDFFGEFNSGKGVVFDRDGNVVKDYTANLTMNTIYQNQFGLDIYDPDVKDQYIFQTYEAVGKELKQLS